MTNGTNGGALANRVALWVSLVLLGAYVLNLGMWVGAADEKFEDAQTVEEKQDQLVIDVNTIQTTQAIQTKAIEANTKAIQESKKEILEAIKEAHKDD